MAERPKTYSSDAIAITFNARRCIHAADCVMNLRRVFDPERRPWIMAEEAAADDIARVVARCPTGALQYERLDAGPEELPDTINVVRVRRNGPLFLRGTIELRDADGALIASGTRFALCRCGASEHGPFCDNSHRRVRFVDSARVAMGGMKADPEEEDRTLHVTVQEGGPYRIEGPVEIRDADGETPGEGTHALLCRCGRSGNRPFCDGSHRKPESDI